MSDTPETPAGENPEVVETPEVTGEDKIERVPVRELQKERRERQKLEKQIADLTKKQDEARQAELSEVEKLREQLEETKQAAAKAEEARVVSEQKSLVRTEAQAHGFADVNDAITFVDFSALNGLEGPELTEAIADEIKRVSETKPYLLAGDKAQPVTDGVTPRGGGDDAPKGDDMGGFVHNVLFGNR